MQNKPKKPFIPAQRQETVRQSIITLLEGRTLSAKEISADVRVSEKDVYEHLEHIQKKKTVRLSVSPAECRKCGYKFIKRERLKKPGRCPLCKRESIQEPLFGISRE